jgi:hypothetical protein
MYKACFSGDGNRSGSGSWTISSWPAYLPHLIALDAETDYDGCLATIDPQNVTHPNSKYVCDAAHLRYVHAHGCVHSASQSLHRLASAPHPLTVTLVGDSMTRETFLSLLGTMRAAWPTRPLKCQFQQEGETSLNEIIVAFQGGLTLRFYTSFKLAPPTSLLQDLTDIIHTADATDSTRHIIVVNTAWHEPETAWLRIKRFAQALRSSQIEPWRPSGTATTATTHSAASDSAPSVNDTRRARRRRPLFVYRQSFAPDFPTPTGEYDLYTTPVYSSCRPPDASPLRCEQSPVCSREYSLFPELAAAGFAILEGWEATAMRAAAAAHIASRKADTVVPTHDRGLGRAKMDCLHFCLPGPLDSVFTEVLLTLVVESLRLGL